MPNDNFIRKEILEIEINKSDACISKMPTNEIRLFRKSLTAHFNKACTTGEYKREFEEMIKRYQTFILQDEIQSTNTSNSVVKCAKMIKEAIF